MGRLLYLLGVKIHGLVPLRVFKSKMTMVRVITVPFEVLKRKNMIGTSFVLEYWYLLGLSHTHIQQNFGTFYGFYSKFLSLTPVTIIYGSPPRVNYVFNTAATSSLLCMICHNMKRVLEHGVTHYTNDLNN